jgi:signal transduction histidine kinase
LITYSGPDHAVTVCQSTAIKRAFVNLIDNAIKYGTCADVNLSEHQNSIAITIIDRGPGIPPNLVEAAFQPFRRLEDSRSRSTGGAGLGLTIARDLIQGHGGDIRLSTCAESGLEVRIRLPIIAL